MPPAPWEEYLKRQFPAFLLPDACRAELDVPTAQRFLATLTGRPDQLELLCLASLVASNADRILLFATRWLPHLVRNLPSRSLRVRREWTGGFQGRLDVPATLAARAGGDVLTFVTRESRRSFDLPETVLLKSVAHRLLATLGLLRRRGVTAEHGWGGPLGAAEGALREALGRSRLGSVPTERLEHGHRQAARSARHTAYRLAAELEQAFRTLVDEPDGRAVATVVAQGALTAVTEERRFELAVLVRLIESLARLLPQRTGEAWVWERSVLESGRREVAVFRERGGTEVALWFNQSPLLPGPRDRGVAKYLGQNGRLRPDITVVHRIGGQVLRACAIEVKCSGDPGYLASGFGEALLYAREYEPLTLVGWPGAILVLPGACHAAPDIEDRVIAVGWDGWTPDLVADALLGPGA